MSETKTYRYQLRMSFADPALELQSKILERAGAAPEPRISLFSFDPRTGSWGELNFVYAAVEPGTPPLHVYEFDSLSEPEKPVPSPRQFPGFAPHRL